ncbi:MAG: Gldg family protein [Methylococcales bacterium]|nr:Gldg family protein [Methylococcales bacterium]
MPHDANALSLIKRIAAKEVSLFFAAPIAYLFLGSFAAVSLFVFFWGESFFARNIADVRPLFEWMPLLLIFLSSTLTMRLWSEERRSGTLEYVYTQPQPLAYFVLGKFAGCLLLLLAALIITLPLPLTVSWLGELDWGPVWGGYLATFLLGATYLSIGLFVSARSDNQIVSLIGAVALCLLFYLPGTPSVSGFFGAGLADWLKALATGSRFEAIARGVIDGRDLYYYLSLTAFFLLLNTFILEQARWTQRHDSKRHQRWRWLTGLLAANVLLANFWIGQITALRIDVTDGQMYSLSKVSRASVQRLEEPLLLRGYFSSKTHPLLAPLVPQLKDLLKEYAVAGGGQVRVELIDPVTDPELEQEANQKYGIQPVPLQVADRYQASIVSSYFNVLVKYGDEYEILGFRDLIEVKQSAETRVEVLLRNPELDITRAIKKVAQNFRGGGNVLTALPQPVTFKAYVSPDNVLPELLVEYRKQLVDSLEKFRADAEDKLSVEFIDPDAGDGQVADKIAQDFGFQPMTTDLLSDQRFYFYLTVAQGEQMAPVPLEDLTVENFERNFKAAIKRFVKGYSKTVALVTPQPGLGQFGMPQGPRFERLEETLQAELDVQSEDLSDGQVSGDADVLLLVAPSALDEKAVFAVDQFLMQGGTVVLATSPYQAELSRSNLALKANPSGLEDWLKHQGVQLGDKLVLDSQSAAFPVPVSRNVAGFMVQELRMLDYPYFLDLRQGQLNSEHPVTASLSQLTVPWAVPVTSELPEGSEVSATELLHSSKNAWLSDDLNVMPRVGNDGESGYAPEGELQSRPLAVLLEGGFTSYFADKTSPLLNDDKTTEQGTQTPADKPVVTSIIKHAPKSARLLVIGSSDLVSDDVLYMIGAAAGSEYQGTLQLLANALTFAVDDSGLSSIRARAHFNRTLPPMDRSVQMVWEYLNYGLAALMLLALALWRKAKVKARQRIYLDQLNGG